MLWDFVESIKKYDLQLKRNALTQVENCNVDMITVLETTETRVSSVSVLNRMEETQREEKVMRRSKRNHTQSEGGGVMSGGGGSGEDEVDN